MHPPPRTEQLAETYINKTAIGQLAVPLVLNLRNLPRRLVVEDVDLAVNDLLLAEQLDDISRLEIHADGIAGVGDFMAKTFDFFKGTLKAVLKNYKQ